MDKLQYILTALLHYYEVERDTAQYYKDKGEDYVNIMEIELHNILDILEASGLSDDVILALNAIAKSRV